MLQPTSKMRLKNTQSFFIICVWSLKRPKELDQPQILALAAKLIPSKLGVVLSVALVAARIGVLRARTAFPAKNSPKEGLPSVYPTSTLSPLFEEPPWERRAASILWW